MHIQSLCQRQNLEEKIIRSRRTDKLTGQRQNVEEKTLRQSDEKLGRKLQVKMNRRTDKVTHVLHRDMRKNNWCF